MEGIQVTINEIQGSEGLYLVKVGGYVDTTTSIELEDAIEKLVRNDVKKIIVDLGSVDYISSAGWGIFISEIKSIREKGGDLKLVRMVPDVYEVFELLEFHNILQAYESLEDAVTTFTKEVERETADAQAAREAKRQGEAESPRRITTSPLKALRGIMDGHAVASGRVSDRDLSVDEKIMTIVRENPEFNTREIRSALEDERFGSVKIHWLELRRRLKALDLDSMRKRIIYARKNM
jgi:anti-sigma B factor antagonist